MRARLFRNFDELPPSYLRLFDEVGRSNFYLSLPWFRNLTATVRDPGDTLRIYGVDDGDGIDDAKAVLVMRGRNEIGGRKGLRTLAGYANFYSMIFAPVMRAGEPRAAAILRTWTKAVAAERPAWDAVHFLALDRDAPSHDQLVGALRAAGFLVGGQPDFGNWYLPVAGMTFDDYVGTLSGSMRGTVRSRGRRLAREHAVRFEFCRDTSGLETTIAAYQHVYDRSWKQPEPYPDFIPGLIRTAAEAGALRMSILYVDETPAAAQFWIVCAGKATIYKLAHDEAFKNLSVGTVLTARIMQEVLAQDSPTEVDYGHGDDPYKKDWLSLRRERRAIEAYNMHTANGLFYGLFLIGGRAIKSWIERISKRSSPKPADGQGANS